MRRNGFIEINFKTDPSSIFPNSAFSICFVTRMGVRFPAHILLVPTDTPPRDSYHTLVPKHRVDARTIDFFDHGCAQPNNRHSITLLDRAYLIALGITFAASAREIVKSGGGKPRVLFPEGRMALS